MGLQEIIIAGIDQWLNRRPGKRSIHSLSKKAGVKYSILINLYNQVTNPPIERLAPVLLIIFGSTKTKALFQEYKPELLDVFSQILGADKSTYQDEDDELYELLERREYFIVFLLCITTGIQSQSLLHLYGRSYNKALKEMVDRNYIEFRNGKYFAKNSFISFPSLRKALNFTLHGLSIFDEDNAEKGANAFFTTQNISASDLNKIAKFQKKCQKGLIDILSNADKDGNLCWYYASFFNFIDPNDQEDIEI